MIPTEWVAHYRCEDNELLGYLIPQPAATGSFQPVTIFGYPMAPAMAPAEARRVLDDEGLSYLAERWYLTLGGREEPIAVTIAEVSPNQVTVLNADYGYEGNIGDPFTLDASEFGCLSRSP